jgi:hypothetical protein
MLYTRSILVYTAVVRALCGIYTVEDAGAVSIVIDAEDGKVRESGRSFCRRKPDEGLSG